MTQRPLLTDLDGIVNLDKPIGWSSAKAVTAVRDCIGGKRRKMGHAGTLDPKAGGVLLLLVGRATHLAELLMDAGKEYVATIRLGATSSTDDTEGLIVPTPGTAAAPAAPPDPARIEAVLRQFVGSIQQQPPAFSALKIDGKRSYRLARRGRSILPAARTVVINAIEPLAVGWPDLRLRIDCGRGTYIRALARDIGVALGVGGYLLELLRTRVGPFRADHAVRPARCRHDNIAEWLLPMERAVDHLPPGNRVSLDAKQVELLARGTALDCRRIAQSADLLARSAAQPGGHQPAIEPLAAFDSESRLVAVCRLIGCAFQPVHVLRPLLGPLPR